MSPAEIAIALNVVGRNDNANDVSAALAYLKRLNRVISVGRARWTTPNRELPVEETAATG